MNEIDYRRKYIADKQLITVKKKERKKESQHKIHKLSVRERDREVAWESGRENKH